MTGICGQGWEGSAGKTSESSSISFECCLNASPRASRLITQIHDHFWLSEFPANSIRGTILSNTEPWRATQRKSHSLSFC